MSRSQEPEKDYFICAHCGARLPVESRFCQECGASEGSGWESDQAQPDGACQYAAEDDEDYDEFLRREFPEYREQDAPAGWRRAVAVTVVLLLCLAFLLMTVLGL